MIKNLIISTKGQGLLEITEQVLSTVHSSKIQEGLCTLFIQHTSASLIIQENADPTAKRDLENWLIRLVPEQNSIFSHTLEGPDDMPSHIKSALTCTSISIPVEDGTLVLGMWQGIYLWEHRKAPHKRTVIIQTIGVN